MSFRQTVTAAEMDVLAGLVETHFKLTGRNPSDSEATEMVGVARELVREAADHE